jgi:hypothetical protein
MFYKYESPSNRATVTPRRGYRLRMCIPGGARRTARVTVAVAVRAGAGAGRRRARRTTLFLLFTRLPTRTARHITDYILLFGGILISRAVQNDWGPIMRRRHCMRDTPLGQGMLTFLPRLMAWAQGLGWPIFLFWRVCTDT